jgi:magnesium transporter
VPGPDGDTIMAQSATSNGNSKDAGSKEHEKSVPSTPAIVTVTKYNDMEYTEETVDPASVSTTNAEFKGVVWIDVDGVEDKATVEQIAKIFNLHPVIVEDILDVEQRPKLVESQDDYLFIEFNTFFRIPTTCEIQTVQYSVILTKTCVITFQQDASRDYFKPVRDRIKAKHGIVRKMGLDYLLYLLLEFAIDNYFAIMEEFEESIDDLEDAIIVESTKENIMKLQQIKRSLIFMRKSIWPMREVLNRLESMDQKIISKGLLIYIRNLYEQVVYLVDMSETFRDILSTTFDIHLATQGNRLNSIVKTLTIISVIFTPLNLIAGFFGMNWLNTPEYSALPVPFLGIMLVTISMITIATLLVRVFKKRKWF